MNKRQKQVQQQFLDSEETVLKRLEYIYDQSLSEVNAKIRHLEFRIEDMREEYDWMDDNDPQKEILRSKIQSSIYRKQYQEQIQTQLDGIMKQMQAKQYTTIAAYLDECYEDGFVGSIFDLHGQGVPLMVPLDQNAMVNAIQLDSKISRGLYTKLGVDADTLKKRIAAQVTRSIATGASWSQVAKRLDGEVSIGRYKSMRIARTEGHRIQNVAAMDAMHGAKDRGADIVKQWDSTLDGKTRESHVAVDMQIRELDEKFDNGLQFPGDPAGGAAEVIHCRCRLNQRARWALDGGSFTKMNNFTKEIQEFESPEAYEEFKKGFFSPENKKYMNHVQDMEKKYGTRDMDKLLMRMNEQEYRRYSKLLANNPVYNKGGADPLRPDRLAGVMRGKEMSFADADTGRVNPNYYQSRGYRVNCQSCVVNYEARRRGYDVQTLPNENNPVAKKLSRDTNLAWIDPATGQHPPTVRCGAKTSKQMLQYMKDNIEEGGRYTFQFYWSDFKSGHIIHAYKENGEVILYDPQVPVEYSITKGDADLTEYFKRIRYQWKGHDVSPNLLRVDTLQFDEDIAKGIMEGVGKK